MEKRAMAVREEQWIQTIAAAKQSGQPIKVWCAEHGVPLSSFYKWQRKMRDSLLTKVQKSDAKRHLHGVLATLSRCKATSQGNSSIMVTRTIVSVQLKKPFGVQRK